MWSYDVCCLHAVLRFLTASFLAYYTCTQRNILILLFHVNPLTKLKNFKDTIFRYCAFVLRVRLIRNQHAVSGGRCCKHEQLFAFTATCSIQAWQWTLTLGGDRGPCRYIIHVSATAIALSPGLFYAFWRLRAGVGFWVLSSLLLMLTPLVRCLNYTERLNVNDLLD